MQAPETESLAEHPASFTPPPPATESYTQQAAQAAPAASPTQSCGQASATMTFAARPATHAAPMESYAQPAVQASFSTLAPPALCSARSASFSPAPQAPMAYGASPYDAPPPCASARRGQWHWPMAPPSFRASTYGASQTYPAAEASFAPQSPAAFMRQARAQKGVTFGQPAPISHRASGTNRAYSADSDQRSGREGSPPRWRGQVEACFAPQSPAAFTRQAPAQKSVTFGESEPISYRAWGANRAYSADPDQRWGGEGSPLRWRGHMEASAQPSVTGQQTATTDGASPTSSEASYQQSCGAAAEPQSATQRSRVRLRSRAQRREDCVQSDDLGDMQDKSHDGKTMRNEFNTAMGVIIALVICRSMVGLLMWCQGWTL